jgi:NAD(P)-dependent dehydrogenase (short-subunit alcohol dehydrogenase family)
LSSLRFEGAVAVVTGAGAGLGRAHALELGRRGASVVVNDLGVTGTGVSAAQSVADEITAAGGTAVASSASVATAEGGTSIIDTAREAFGRVDIVINNAGILRPQPFVDMDFDVLGAVIDVHLKGAFHVTQPAFRLMQAQGSGAILNTTSGAIFGVGEQINYAAAKGGILGFTKCLAIEGAGCGVRVNAIMPIASTNMTAGFFPGGLDALLAPEYPAALAAWLVHPECSTTGEVFTVGGGHVARVFLGETAGWTQSGLQQHSAEAVRDNFDYVVDTTNFSIPPAFADEMSLTVEAVVTQAMS